jgi:hypothetical protein
MRNDALLQLASAGIALLTLQPVLAWADTSAPSLPAELPVVVHVASEKTASGPRPLIERELLERMVVRAGEILAPSGISFRLAEVRSLPAGRHLDMRSRWSRNALARAAGAPLLGAVEVFIVRTLGNLDGPGLLGGVHWRYRGRGDGPVGRHYVILGIQKYSLETLAHELGHYFGLPHSWDRHNIMRQCGRVATQLRRWQLLRMQRRLGLFVRLGKLSPEPVPATSAEDGAGP